MIYFIQAENGGPVKIGRSGTIEKRIKEFQCGNPYLLRLVGSSPGNTQYEENLMHERFTSTRIRDTGEPANEWFWPTEEMNEFCWDLVVGGAEAPDVAAIAKGKYQQGFEHGRMEGHSTGFQSAERLMARHLGLRHPSEDSLLYAAEQRSDCA